MANKIDEVIANLQKGIKDFIDNVATAAEQQGRLKQVREILKKIELIKEMKSPSDRAAELDKIIGELHGIGIKEELKFNEHYTNSDDPSDDLIDEITAKAEKLLQEQQADILKKLAEEEEKKRIEAADARAAEDARKKALDNQRKFLTECHVLLKELKVIKGQMVALKSKINKLTSDDSEISHKIQLAEKRDEILLRALGDHRAQSASKIVELEAKIEKLTTEDLDLKEKEKTVDTEVSAVELEIKTISETKEAFEQLKLELGGATTHDQKIEEQAALFQTKTALLESKKLEQAGIKSKLSEVALALGNAVKEKELIKKAEDSILQAVSDNQDELKKSQQVKSNISNELTQSNQQLSTVSKEYEVKNTVVTEKLREGISKETDSKYKNEQETMALQKELSDIQEELNINKDFIFLKESEIRKVAEKIREQKKELGDEPDAIKKLLIQAEIPLFEQHLATLEQEKSTLTQEGEKLTQQLTEKNKEIEVKKPGLPATPSFVAEETNVLNAEAAEQKIKELKALEDESSQLQIEISEKQKDIDSKSEIISQKLDELTALIGEGDEDKIGPKTEEQEEKEKKIEELHQEVFNLEKERDALAEARAHLDKKLEENIKKAEAIKKNSSNPAIVVDDSNKKPKASIPTGTSDSSATNLTANTSGSNTTSVTTAIPKNSTTNVSAAPATPEEKEKEKKWDKLGLPPDLSGSDDSIKNFWLMLFAMLTDVLPKTLAQDRKRIKALWNYAGGQIELHYANKSGDKVRIQAAEKRVAEATVDFKQAFGLPLEGKITRLQMIRAVGSMIPLLSSSAYVQRFAYVDAEDKNNKKEDNQNNSNTAQLQNPSKDTTKNPTVSANNNQNLVTANTNTSPTVTTNQSSTQTTNTTNQQQANTQSQSTTLKQVGVNAETKNQATASSSDTQAAHLETLQDASAGYHQSADGMSLPKNAQAANDPLLFQGQELNNMNKLNKISEQTNAAENTNSNKNKTESNNNNNDNSSSSDDKATKNDGNGASNHHKK